jgi:hypothetical protein
MARCLRCEAGNEWIEGDVPPLRTDADWVQIITDILAEGVMEAQCMESMARNRKRRETLARRILAALNGEDEPSSPCDCGRCPSGKRCDD